jgi:hypothetical protein
MRAEEALRTTGLWGTVGDFFKGLFTGKKVATGPVPAPPVKVEQVPALPDPDIPREIVIIKKTQVTAPPSNGPPRNWYQRPQTPPNVPLLTINDGDIKLLYENNPRWLLQEFKKLSPKDQKQFNAKIKKLKLGPALDPLDVEPKIIDGRYAEI